MRLFLFVLFLFAIPLLVFLVLNPDEQVTVNLGTTVYADVRLSTIVSLALLIGAALVGIIAVAEGAAIRLANRRLRRELHKLETEVNLLRTEPPRVSPAREPEPVLRRTSPVVTEPARHEELPTAPVYSGDEFDAYGDD